MQAPSNQAATELSFCSCERTCESKKSPCSSRKGHPKAAPAQIATDDRHHVQVDQIGTRTRRSLGGRREGATLPTRAVQESVKWPAGRSGRAERRMGAIPTEVPTGLD